MALLGDGKAIYTVDGEAIPSPPHGEAILLDLLTVGSRRVRLFAVFEGHLFFDGIHHELRRLTLSYPVILGYTSCTPLA